MRRHQLTVFALAIGILTIGCGAAYADPFTFDTLPASGAVSGPAGSTVGWGYTLSNPSSTYWLVTSALSADLFQNGTPASLFDFPILAPGATVTVPFDAANGFGLYQLTWNANAPVGFTNTGTFLLGAEFWTADPFAGGTFLSAATDQSAGYSASVINSVPGPSTWLLFATGVAGLVLFRKTERISGRT